MKQRIYGIKKGRNLMETFSDEFMVEQAAFTEQQDSDAADGSIVHMYEYNNQFVDR